MKYWTALNVWIYLSEIINHIKQRGRSHRGFSEDFSYFPNREDQIIRSEFTYRQNNQKNTHCHPQSAIDFYSLISLFKLQEKGIKCTTLMRQYLYYSDSFSYVGLLSLKKLMTFLLNDNMSACQHHCDLFKSIASQLVHLVTFWSSFFM